MRKRKRLMQRSFFVLFLTVALVLVIPLCLVFSGWAFAMKTIVLQDYISMNQQIMENVSAALNTSITSQVNFSYSLKDITSLKKLAANLTVGIADQQETSQELRNFMRSILFNNLASMTALYFPSLDLVISSESYNTSLEDFYKRCINFQDVSYEDFRRQIREVEIYRYFPSTLCRPVDTVSRRILLYAQPIHLGYLDQRAYYMTVIDEKALADSVFNSFSGDVAFQLFDNVGTELIRSDGVEEAWAMLQREGFSAEVLLTGAGHAYRVFTPRALSCGLRFVFYVPESTVMRQINLFIGVCLVTAAGCLLLGLLLANAIARRLHSPYETLLTTAFPEAGTSHEPRSMGEGFHLLTARMRETQQMNRQFQRELAAYFATARDNALLLLITRSAYLSTEELEEAAEICGLSLRYSAYQVAILKAMGPELGAPDLPMDEDPSISLAMTRLSSMQFVLVAAFPAERTASPLPELLEQSRGQFRVGLSQIHDTIGDLSHGIAEAEMDCPRRQENALQDPGLALRYPMDQELQIMAAVRDGRFDEVSQLLTMVRESNQAVFSGDGLAQLYGPIALTAIKVYEQLPGEQKAPLEASAEQLAQLGQLALGEDQFFGEILGFYRQLCNVVSSDIHQKNQSIVENVREYLRENYADTELCLDHVAEHLGVSYYFLSRIFKSEANQSFTDMLHDARIARAMALLQATALPVQEISLQVGYTNWSTFLRAFRKRAGTTPVQYRKAAAPEQ